MVIFFIVQFTLLIYFERPLFLSFFWHRCLITGEHNLKSTWFHSCRQGQFRSRPLKNWIHIYRVFIIPLRRIWSVYLTFVQRAVIAMCQVLLKLSLFKFLLQFFQSLQIQIKSESCSVICRNYVLLLLIDISQEICWMLDSTRTRGSSLNSWVSY